MIDFARITQDPDQMGGVPCVRGMRLPVSVIVDEHRSGMTHASILRLHPELDSHDIDTCVAFAEAAERQASGDASWPIERIANAHGFNDAITFMEENADLSLWRGALSSSIEPDESLVNACTDSTLSEVLGVAVLHDAEGGWTPEAEAALADYNAGYREAIKEALADKEQS